jgi:sugar (pentulose or hexulose) kinase
MVLPFGATVISGRTVVVDIGKSNAKITLWGRGGELIARRSRANDPHPPSAAAWRTLDVHGIDAWLVDSLRALAAGGAIARIVPVGHGAAAALLRHGRLYAEPMDYEIEVSPADRAEYYAQRDEFGKTGSPALPQGLNLGLQLYLLEKTLGPFPDDLVIVLWPQYWSWRLCGVAASEVTSLGCHTDLWQPANRDFSALAIRRGWAARLAPLRRAADTLGPITAELAAATALNEDCQVLCGLHDSNAALLAARGHTEIASHEATVLSTGTWFVAMRSPAADSHVELRELDEWRDCLVNVDVERRPTPSARFMGGREAELAGGVDSFRLTGDCKQSELLARVPALVERGVFAVPGFVPGVGPYPDAPGTWIHRPEDPLDLRAATALYLALMADATLDLVGSRERLLVEGRFAEEEVFIRTLAGLSPGQRVYTSNAEHDVAYGALRLVAPDLPPVSSLTPVEPLPIDLADYARTWRRLAERAQAAS